jgi:hypothetical protein
MGEDIRGSTLGAMDTVSKDDTTKHEETAQKGRLQMERGLANLRGGPSHEQGEMPPSTKPETGK